MKQLQRTINEISYYCELITSNHLEAINRKKVAKKAGFKARIFKLANKYGVFIN